MDAFCKGRSKVAILMKWMVLVVGALLAAQAASALPTIELVTHDIPPYVMLDAAGTPVDGMALRTLQCALQQLGVPYRLRNTPWARGQKSVELGQAAGFFPASRNSERDGWAVYAGPLAPQEWRWYLLKESRWEPSSRLFRDHAVVTAYHGSNMMQWLNNSHYRILGNPLSHDQLLDVLLNQRVDAVLAASLTMDELVRKAGVAGRIRSVSQENRPLGVYFSRKFLAQMPADFIPRFNARAVQCRAHG